MTETLPASIAGALGTGLPVLLLQFAICIVLLVVGVAIYTKVTPFHERELLREGNVAAATVLSGAVIALAIPLAALLATTRAVLDIVVWGIVAILLQLVTVVIACHLMRRMRLTIEDGKSRGSAADHGGAAGDRIAQRGRDDSGLTIRRGNKEDETMLQFMRNLVGVKADKAVQAGVDALVRWDPQSASEAEMRTMEQHLDELGQQVARARQSYDKEMREANAIQWSF